MLLPTPAVCSEVEPQHCEHTSAERGHRRSSHSGLRLYCAGHHHYMKPTPLDLTEIVESVTKGDPKRAKLLNFGVDRATAKRYRKRLDECGTLVASKRSGRRTTLDQRAAKPLAKDLKERLWATHS